MIQKQVVLHQKAMPICLGSWNIVDFFSTSSRKNPSSHLLAKSFAVFSIFFRALGRMHLSHDQSLGSFRTVTHVTRISGEEISCRAETLARLGHDHHDHICTKVAAALHCLQAMLHMEFGLHTSSLYQFGLHTARLDPFLPQEVQKNNKNKSIQAGQKPIGGI